MFEANIQKNDGVEAQLEFRYEQIKEQIARLNSEIQHQEVSVMLVEKRKDEGKQKLLKLTDEINTLETRQNELIDKKAYLEKEKTKMSPFHGYSPVYGSEYTLKGNISMELRQKQKDSLLKCRIHRQICDKHPI